MSIEDLYQEELTHHSQYPCNKCHPLENFTHGAEGKNPLCGDVVKLHLVVEDDTLRDIAFGGEGCVISQSAASLLTEAVKGKTLVQCRELGSALEEALALPRQTTVSAELHGRLGGMQALLGVRQFPVRKKCALLAWQTFKKALGNS